MFKLWVIIIIVRFSFIIRLCSRLSRWVCIDIFSLLVGLFINISFGCVIRLWVICKCCCILLEKVVGRLSIWLVGIFIFFSYFCVVV